MGAKEHPPASKSTSLLFDRPLGGQRSFAATPIQLQNSRSCGYQFSSLKQTTSWLCFAKSLRHTVIAEPGKKGKFWYEVIRSPPVATSKIFVRGAWPAVTIVVNATVWRGGLRLELHWLAHVHDVHDVHDWHPLSGAVCRPQLPECYPLATTCGSACRCHSFGSGRCRPLRSRGPFRGCARGWTAPNSIHNRCSSGPGSSARAT